MRLHTLGALDLRGSDGRELRVTLAQPKRIALLAYLALATPRGFHRRDTLIALFWPEHDEEHARNSLSQSVHVLRLALGASSLVSRNGDALSLDWADFWCDAVAFEEAIDTGRLGDAVELYRGDLLDGFHVAGTPELDRWLEAGRERLARRYMGALESLAGEREAAADFVGAAAWWRRLAARDPYSSRVAVRVMRALAAAGDPAAAVQHARVHEALLRQELDVAADPEVTALARQLQSAPAEEHCLTSQTLPAPWKGSSVDEEAETIQALRPAGHRRARRRWVAMAAAAVVLSAAAAGVVAFKRAGAAAATPSIRSLAVLPLEDLSSDSTRQAFADALQDALITELARYPELSVISRTSVERYKGTKKTLPEIARELNVDGIVEGTVLREGGRIRMNAQLIHGSTDRHLWARSYQRNLRDVLVLQSELAQAIASEVRVAAAPAQQWLRPMAGHPDSLPNELYLRELYIRGRNAELSRSPLGIETAKDAYRLAIEHDSAFALGYAGLAGVYGFIADYALGPSAPALDSARIMAHHAIALDSMLPEAHTALAVTLSDARQFDAAEREFQRAIELGPSNAHAHFWYSILLVALGRGADALRESQRALSLDPVAPRGVLAMQRYAHWLLTGEHPQLKLPVAERRPVLKLEPGEPWARGREGVEFAQVGECAAARSSIARAQQLAPNNIRTLSFLGEVYWRCGERSRARSLVNEMKQRPDARDHGYRIAVLYVLFGQKDSAFAWLDRHRWTTPGLAALSADVFVDPLRSDPRFPQLLRRLGIRQ